MKRERLKAGDRKEKGKGRSEGGRWEGAETQGGGQTGWAPAAKNEARPGPQGSRSPGRPVSSHLAARPRPHS